jgi:hypothetical protein
MSVALLELNAKFRYSSAADCSSKADPHGAVLLDAPARYGVNKFCLFILNTRVIYEHSGN